MPTITRRLPQSNDARLIALGLAHEKQINLPPGSPAVLTPPTVTRLAAMFSNYGQAMLDVGVARAPFSDNTPVKDANFAQSRMFTSHYFQAFNNGVARGKFTAGQRAFFQLDPGSEAVPDLKSEANVLLWGHRIVDGDPLRLAAGGAPMSNPDTAEVDAKMTAANNSFILQSTLADALDIKQEAVEAMNVEADKVIKKVWDEVETFYNEETPESKRANARQWAVVYVTEGAQNTVTGLAKNAGGVPQPGADVVIVESGADTVTNPEGRYAQPTSLTGTITIRVTIGALKGEAQVTIPEDAEGQTIEVPDIVVG